MNDLVQLILSALTVILKDSGKADDAAKLLAMGLSAWTIGSAAKAQFDVINAELKAMQEAGHQPTREEKDAKYQAILDAIDSVSP